jgi:hypothetical protein
MKKAKKAAKAKKAKKVAKAKKATKTRKAPRARGRKRPRSGKKPPSKGGVKTLVVDPRTENVIKFLAINTPDSLSRASALLDVIIGDNEISIYEMALKGYMLVNSWRNGIDEVAPEDVFEQGRTWAQGSIAAATQNSIDSPYGDWVMAYVLKYEGRPQLSAFHYQLAMNYDEGAFLDDPLRKRKHLIGEWTESQLYWLKQDELGSLVDVLDFDPPDADESWMNWVKCFAYHMMGDYDASNALYPDQLPSDVDVSLIIAANHARLGNEKDRQDHRDRFQSKSGNELWTVAMEMDRSPFVDDESRSYWEESVILALS